MKRIASRANPHYKSLLRLAQAARERRQSGLSLLDGAHLLLAWEAAQGAAEELIVSDSGLARGEIADIVAARPRVPTTHLPDALFAPLSSVDTATGLLAVVAIPRLAGAPSPAVASVVLDGVQDPGNLGSILRSAAAAGYRQVVCSGDCAQVWGPRCLRAGMGAQFALELHEGVDLPAFVEGFAGTSVVTRADAGHELFSAPLPPPLAWIFGSEGQGVRAPVAARAKLALRIPMPGVAESLNVAAAAAICLFESVRRARQPS